MQGGVVRPVAFSQPRAKRVRNFRLGAIITFSRAVAFPRFRIVFFKLIFDFDRERGDAAILVQRSFNFQQIANLDCAQITSREDGIRCPVLCLDDKAPCCLVNGYHRGKNFNLLAFLPGKSRLHGLESQGQRSQQGQECVESVFLFHFFTSGSYG
ncbi:MAG TPA: hypothetical protein DCG54_09585 [Anaerolineae bacterium]|nr:hypothetical protein [Anaerolineae bacterium]